MTYDNFKGSHGLLATFKVAKSAKGILGTDSVELAYAGSLPLSGPNTTAAGQFGVRQAHPTQDYEYTSIALMISSRLLGTWTARLA